MLFYSYREDKIMNKKFKFASAVLSAGLLITPISGLVSNYDNVAKASYNNSLTEKEIQEASIIKNYILITKQKNIYNFKLINKENLINELNKINSKLTINDIQNDIDKINNKLKEENNDGPLTNNIKNIMNEYKLKNENHNSFYKWTVCGTSFFLLGSGVDLGYLAVGALAGPGGLVVGATAAALTAAIGAAGLTVC